MLRAAYDGFADICANPRWRSAADRCFLFLLGMLAGVVTFVAYCALIMGRRTTALAPESAGDAMSLGFSILAGLFPVAAVVAYVVWQSRSNKEAPDASADLDRLLASEPLAPARQKRELVLVQLMEKIEDVVRGKLLVKDLMSDTCETCSPDTPLVEVARLMHERHVSHVLVCSSYRKLTGIISEHDLTQGEGRKASDVMTTQPVCIGFTEPLSQAVDLMARRGFSCLPVMRGDQLAGVITSSDLAMAMRCTLELLGRVSDGQLTVGAP